MSSNGARSSPNILWKLCNVGFRWQPEYQTFADSIASDSFDRTIRSATPPTTRPMKSSKARLLRRTVWRAS